MHMCVHEKGLQSHLLGLFFCRNVNNRRCVDRQPSAIHVRVHEKGLQSHLLGLFFCRNVNNRRCVDRQPSAIHVRVHFALFPWTCWLLFLDGAALRIIDVSVAVVTNIEGCAAQTVTVFHLLQKRVIPNLFVDKAERCTLEVQVKPGDTYNRFWSATRMST